MDRTATIISRPKNSTENFTYPPSVAIRCYQDDGQTPNGWTCYQCKTINAYIKEKGEGVTKHSSSNVLLFHTRYCSNDRCNSIRVYGRLPTDKEKEEILNLLKSELKTHTAEMLNNGDPERINNEGWIEIESEKKRRG